MVLVSFRTMSLGTPGYQASTHQSLGCSHPVIALSGSLVIITQVKLYLLTFIFQNQFLFLQQIDFKPPLLFIRTSTVPIPTHYSGTDRSPRFLSLSCLSRNQQICELIKKSSRNLTAPARSLIPSGGQYNVSLCLHYDGTESH